MASEDKKDAGGLKSLDPEPSSSKSSVKSASKDATEQHEDDAKDSSKDSAKESAKEDASKEESKNESAEKSENTSPKDGTPANESKSSSTAPGDADAPPSRPPRPSKPPMERRPSAFTSNLSELKQAFPDSEENFLRAILVAASNNLQSAFNGMLALNDPTIRPFEYVKRQIESDEVLARKIAVSEQRRQRRPARPSRTYDYYDEEPTSQSGYQENEIYDGIQRGYNGTKQAVSSLWGNFKTRFNGEINDEDPEELYRRRNSSRSSWWPQQGAANDQHTFISTEDDLPNESPKLPARRPKPTAEAAKKSDSPAAATPAKETKSVNAFGDEISSEDAAKTEEQEPDAFFIGESDDDELGSLNEDLSDHEAPVTESASSPKPKDSTGSTETTGAAAEDEKGTTADRKNSTAARDLLNKVKSEAK